MAIDEDAMDDLAMLATKEVEETPRAHQNTAGPKTTGLMPNPLDLLVKGIKATELETYDFGLDTYFEEPSNELKCPKTFDAFTPIWKWK